MTYPNTLHVQIHDIPKYMTYPITWHTLIDDIPKYMTYSNTWHAQIHDMPKYMSAPFYFYILQFTLPGEVRSADNELTVHILSKY